MESKNDQPDTPADGSISKDGTAEASPEFWETEEMYEMNDLLNRLEYLDHKVFDDYWCEAENLKDLKWSLEAGIDEAWGEMIVIADKYRELFNEQLELPLDRIFKIYIKYRAQDLKKSIGLKERWKDIHTLKIVADTRTTEVKSSLRELVKLYAAYRGK